MVAIRQVLSRLGHHTVPFTLLHITNTNIHDICLTKNLKRRESDTGYSILPLLIANPHLHLLSKLRRALMGRETEFQIS
jgi:hypothetical protein